MRLADMCWPNSSCGAAAKRATLPPSSAPAGRTDRRPPFTGGWQAGLRRTSVFAARPDSELSFGVQQAYLSADFRDVLRQDGRRPARAESGAELTYADRLGPIAIQPDLQVIHHPGGERDRDLVWIGGLRLSIAIS